jgi:hypothetical protein
VHLPKSHERLAARFEKPALGHKDSGIVHGYIDPPETIDRMCNRRGGADFIGDACEIRHRFTSAGADFMGDYRGRPLIAAFASQCDSWIVDDNPGSARRQQSRIGSA